ncbi:DEAD/DEAH box helicase [Legionella sp. km772]|uniref:DEAD/DEAH box helicase n=1 Tax=Legionella sp. km772 TaxID=2498111 RepID=UPI000F8C9118|nr:DEAD/DEAH box helicase [Legionella sp. km772]RUR06574.1 DEAD/DEAH box helicase [Legionella sp. km772]
MDNYLHWAHPLVTEWFSTSLGSPSEPQQLAWPLILEGRDTLISAPTGSGKTLAAFLVGIDALVRQALSATLNNETAVLYVSPLKAVSNDIQKNLMKPLQELKQLAQEHELLMQDIHVAVRTGDTPMKERQAMLKKPPHILVTTPESLYILLTSEKSRLFLRSVKTIIVDEIHALASSKRGSHLSLSLERLEALTYQKPIRIGLSATQRPISIIGKFLTGNARPKPEIINIGHAKHLQLTIEVPKSELTAVASNNHSCYARSILSCHIFKLLPSNLVRSKNQFVLNSKVI